jgi:Bacteriophage Lambda NinG protein
MKLKPKKPKYCAVCEKEFKQYRSTDKVCGVECAIKYGESKPTKVSKKSQLEPLKTLSDFRKDLEQKINLIVRLIDKDQPCISCGRIPNKPFAGHYHSVGSNETIRFNLLNIFCQCFSCNGFKGGMLLDYGKGLRNTYGNEIKEYCEFTMVSEYKAIKLNQHEIIAATKQASEIVRQLVKANKTYNVTERIEMREQFNLLIGIYK